MAKDFIPIGIRSGTSILVHPPALDPATADVYVDGHPLLRAYILFIIGIFPYRAFVS